MRPNRSQCNAKHSANVNIVTTVVKPLAISMGDPAGIGPEIIVRALLQRVSLQRSVIVFGDLSPWQRAQRLVGQTLPNVQLVQCDGGGDDVPLGVPSAASGAASVCYLDAATTAVIEGQCSALVTAPLSKQWAQSAGFSFAGHTEYLAHRCGVAQVVMMFAGPSLKVALVTVHRPLAAVSAALTTNWIVRVCELFIDSLRARFGIAAPRIAVLGLNPHAGENGTIGREEVDIIGPAVEVAQRLTLIAPASIVGPWVPDAAFRRALHGEVDGLVAMYHDQALIPIKLIDFDDAVNVTLGLPMIRTSPDHGTAFDIASRGTARANSMIAAIDLAITMQR
jgi:4-hydroxythreonine-4-phosphate dehydrogenase